MHHLPKRALLIVDLQNDFMPQGALGVPHADALIPLVNRLISHFSLVVATQDWHPADHCSFAANHPGKKVGETILIDGMEQILWPIHCVANTGGAAFAPGLNQEALTAVFHKGTDRRIDSYSAFFDNAHLKFTGLGDFLQSHGVDQVFIVGVATDYCVLYSALDAVELGFSVFVISDACRGIDLHPGDEKKAYIAMKAAGARILSSDEVLSI